MARHPGAVKRATSYAERLRLSIAVIHGQEKVAESERDDGRYSPPPRDLGKSSSDNKSDDLRVQPGDCWIELTLNAN